MGAIKKAVTGAWRAWSNASTSGSGCHPSSIVTNTTGSVVVMWSTRAATPGGGGSVVVVDDAGAGALTPAWATDGWPLVTTRRARPPVPLSHHVVPTAPTRTQKTNPPIATAI